MKIQIDTDKKVLRLESDVNLGEFMTKIKVLFPDNAWKKYKLETNVDIQWTNPIYIDRWPQPYYPWTDPGPWPNRITYTDNSELYDFIGDVLDNTTTNLQLTSGTYCIEA